MLQVAKVARFMRAGGHVPGSVDPDDLDRIIAAPLFDFFDSSSLPLTTSPPLLSDLLLVASLAEGTRVPRMVSGLVAGTRRRSFFAILRLRVDLADAGAAVLEHHDLRVGGEGGVSHSEAQ